MRIDKEGRQRTRNEETGREEKGMRTEEKERGRIKKYVKKRWDGETR